MNSVIKNKPHERFKYREFGSDYAKSGIFTRLDWRYELLVDYLKESPSYQLARRARLAKPGLKPIGTPKDWGSVLAVYEDFGDLFRIEESKWWSSAGRHLFGVKAKEPELLNLGLTKKSLTEPSSLEDALTEWGEMDSPESLVLAIPTSLTKKEAMTQFAALLKTQKFRTQPTSAAKPKYQLSSSKLRKPTLVLGPWALHLYKKGVPLWKIGYQLKLSESSIQDIDSGVSVSTAKSYLSILASKLIHKAELIAENAARGRFPSDKAFPEAILVSNQRKVGRPKKS